MACRRYAPDLTGVAAGESPSAELAAHLEVCPDCTATLAGLRQSLALVDDELASIGSVGVPPELAARVSQRLRDEADLRRVSVRAVLTIASAVAVGVLLIAGALGWFSAARQSPSSAIAVRAPEAGPPAGSGDRPVAPAQSIDPAGQVAMNGSVERPRSTVRRSSTAGIPVLVSQAQRDAVRRLMRQAAGKIDDADASGTAGVAAPDPIAPVTVAPIVVGHIEMEAPPASSGGPGARGAEHHE
jgi:hypothetical protein